MNLSETIKSNAKINLSLDVLNLREDGYHNIDSIFQEISLHDTINISINKTSEIKVSTNVSNIPNNEKNIAFKAAKMYLEHVQEQSLGVEIFIDKKIPSEAGLGGGSSNAANVLTTLDKLLNFNVPKDNIFKIASKIGADVPFFLIGGICHITGIGEQITQVENMSKFHILVAKGSNGISTASAYKKIDTLTNRSHHDTAKILNAISKNDIFSLSKECLNTFELVTEDTDVFKIKNIMINNGAIFSLLSGSGSSVFGIFENENHANNCNSILKATFPFCESCSNII